MKLEFSRRIFEKYSNIKFHKNSCSGSRVVPCGRPDGQTNMTKPIVASRNFANAPKNYIFLPQSKFLCFLWISEQRPFICLLNIYWLVFIAKTECVYCAVRTGYLNIIQVNHGLWRSSILKEITFLFQTLLLTEQFI